MKRGKPLPRRKPLKRTGYLKRNKPMNRTGTFGTVKKARISVQRRNRMNRDAEYNALNDIYLEENPYCAKCGSAAQLVHHIVRGTGGRPRSLLNSDTWLGLCGEDCHDAVESMTPEAQIRLKQKRVRETIERLRR